MEKTNKRATCEKSVEKMMSMVHFINAFSKKFPQKRLFSRFLPIEEFEHPHEGMRQFVPL